MSCNKVIETICEVCKRPVLYSRHLAAPPKTCGRSACEEAAEKKVLA
jgi:hypothetical protein